MGEGNRELEFNTLHPAARAPKYDRLHVPHLRQSALFWWTPQGFVWSDATETFSQGSLHRGAVHVQAHWCANSTSDNKLERQEEQKEVGLGFIQVLSMAPVFFALL